MYTVGNFLTNIKNAALIGKSEVSVPFSKISEAVGKLLVKEGYLKSAVVIPAKDKERKRIAISILINDGKAFLTNLRIISKPGVRIYLNKNEIGKKGRGFKTLILSTNKGIVTNKEAVKLGLGGEVIAEVW